MNDLFNTVVVAMITSAIGLFLEYWVVQPLRAKREVNAEPAQDIPVSSKTRKTSSLLLTMLPFAVVSVIAFMAGTQLERLSVGETARIISPVDDDFVDTYIVIRGTAQNIPQDRHLWVFVFVRTTSEYFLTPINKTNSGDWRVGNVQIGEEGEYERGNAFELGLISVNSQDNQLLIQNRYHLTELPDSNRVHQSIIVTRK